MPQQGFKPAPQYGHSSAGVMEGVNGTGEVLCKVGTASPEVGAGKGAAPVPLPCYGDPPGHFTPVSLPPPSPGAAVPCPLP